MQNSAILLTFIKLPFVIKIFVLSIFEWPFYTVLPYNTLANSEDPDKVGMQWLSGGFEPHCVVSLSKTHSS